MGVLNLTPDSFSDGGQLGTVEAALERARDMERDGADLLDLGAESTRPGGGVYGDGAATVPSDEERERLLPTLERLRAATELPISVDTRKAAVAEAALTAGADLINDVSALGDPRMAGVVASAGCPLVLMHSRGELGAMQRDIAFEDLLSEIVEELSAAVERAVAAGIRRSSILVDPGIGFGKATDHNLSILRHVQRLRELGRPILVGASRKSFLGRVTGRDAGDRLASSLAAAAWSATHGVEILRVHDVRETVDLLRTLAAIERGTLAGDRAEAGEVGAAR